MTGDAPDMAARIRQALPDRWFADDAPVLDALLGALATGMAAVFDQVQFAVAQTRLRTVSGMFLDLAARDFRGAALRRRVGEADAQLRRRLLPVFRDKATRAALSARLLDLTGNTPRIFEPSRPADTGGWGRRMGYGVAGRYGSLLLPHQVFVDVGRPRGAGIPRVAGWRTGRGGYRTGRSMWGAMDDALPHVTDADIYAAVADVIPAGAVAWVQLGGATLNPVP